MFWTLAPVTPREGPTRFTGKTEWVIAEKTMPAPTWKFSRFQSMPSCLTVSR